MRRKLVSWYLIVSVVMSLFAAFPMNAHAFNKDTMNSLCPIYAYPQDWDDDGYFPTYTTNECTTKAGKIHKNDYCTITNFYYKNDKWIVKVKYPVSGGTKTAYAKAIRFFPDCYSSFEPYKQTAASKTYVSKRAGAATESGWYISSGDKFYVITRDGSGNAQVVYPVSGGYKMGWIKHYNVKYNANGGSGAPSTQHKIQNVNLTLSSSKPSRTGYTFNSWNTSKDGSGTKYSAGATYTGNKAITLYAQWKVNPYAITVTSANTTMGTVSGGGTYNYGTSVTITASPKTGYRFVKWSDGNTSASRSVKVTGKASYTAYFEANSYTLSAKSADSSMGYTTGGGTVKYNSNGTITAVPNTGHYFVKWNDNVTTNPRTVKVTGNVTYTAYFAKYSYTVSAQLYDITTDKVNNSLGTVTGTGSYPYGTYITLKATPNSGNSFVEWSDGNTSATRTIQVTGNCSYTAYFADKDTCPHVFGNYIIDNDSTCSVLGSKHRVCTICAYSETDIVPLKSHTLSDWIVDKAATCEEVGSKHQVCTKCSAVMPSETINPLGHSYEESIVAPTCTVKGTKTLTCKRDGCGYTTTEEIRYPGHNYELSESSKTGYSTLVCTACDDVIERRLYTFGEDTYSFMNDAKTFARKSSRLNKKENTPTFDIKTFYSVFANQYDDKTRENFIQPIYEANKYWNGVCFGMSASSLAFYNKDLNLTDYADTETVFDIEAPETYISNGGIYFDNVKGPLMVHLRSLIEFFQVSQHREEIIFEYHNNISSDNLGWAKLDDLIKAVKTFVDTGENGLIIRVQGESGQHAIVPVSYSEEPKCDEAKCAFEIGIYDNSAPNEVYTLHIYKDGGNYSGFSYQGNRYRQLISYNMLDTVFNLMVDTMVDEDNASDITETLSYARIYTNSDDVTITNSDGVDIATLNEAYKITISDSDNFVKYLVPYGDYVVTNNNESISDFEVTIIGPKDAKIASVKDNKSIMHVGIHNDKKSTYVKATKSDKGISLFSDDADSVPMTITNISENGVRDVVEAEAEYVVLNTSSGTLDIASDVSTVILNGDEVSMKTVDVEEEPDESTDVEVSVESNSGILVNMTHMNSILKAPAPSEDDSAENITSCQIGAQNIGFSTDAVNNSEYNYTLSVKANELTYNNGLVSGNAEFNIYNNSEMSNYACILFSVYKNDGILVGEYIHECMLGINNNYIKANDIEIEVPENIELYVKACVLDIDDIQLSDEVELLLPDEPDYSLRVISDNLVLEEKVIRGDVQIDVHTKDYISGNCKAYLCFYSEQGRLLGLYTQDVNIDSIDTPVPFTEISIPCEDDKWTAKCLLWSGDDTLIPLSTPVELVIEEAE